jgi:hypothetical protein
MGVADIAMTADGAMYLRIDGRPYELLRGQLAPVPADLGVIVIADARIVVLANAEESAVWVSVAGDHLRPYSINACRYAAG